ncbi:MAG: UDP-glucose/GDP-mannose dehydrogenase family protein [Alphaproteobacteria bacterium]|nr:UDP-glucose/GDP-mannose dehydrogenase family protein [Alphaproteobacteria bacterium]
MNITVIGSGYVGLVSGACFSEFGFNVTCVDKDADKIARLKGGEIPIYEPGLDDLVERNMAAGRLSFSTDLAAPVAAADAVFIAVGTPTRRGDGHADLSYVYAASEEVARHLSGYTVIVTKSTVPVGTGREVEGIVRKTNPAAEVDVASNPEFLREGSAINDFMRPDRVVVGTENERAREVMRALYRPLFLRETPILFTTLETSELIKYASNAFLAVKISYINQMADLCEVLGANVHDVAKGMGLDKRIGPKFLHPGPGYGGSCFPKDTLALVKTAEDAGRDVTIVNDVVRYNAERKIAMADRVIAAGGGDVRGKTIAVLGLAFKPETDDMRDSPALDILPRLAAQGAVIKAYDPAAMDQAKPLLPEAVQFQASAMDCLDGADITVVITEWNEFRALTPAVIKAAMAGDAVVDLRNIFDPAAVLAAGLSYQNIGRAGM